MLEPCASIELTRGCPWDCTFCSAWTFYGRSHRAMSHDRVFEELVRRGERFGLPPGRTQETADRVADFGIVVDEQNGCLVRVHATPVGHGRGRIINKEARP